MKKSNVFLLAFMQIFCSVSILEAQNLNRQGFPDMELKNQRRLIEVPDIDGYITLKGDFHMHTIFSDGAVWPETRVEEAWADGLDVIAITDHDTYHPNKEFLISDNNTHYKIALESAKSKNIILIQAIEITRKMPPGHLNALFVTDGNIPELNDTSRQAFLTSVEKLHNQGAVIFWNHPGWVAQQKDSVKWFDVHQALTDKGWLNGIEVFNSNEWYPVALQWAIIKNLAPFANSDVHDAMRFAYNYQDNFIRPMTLVFAKEPTEESIRQAMLDKRTVAWFNGHLAGSEELLGKLFDQSFKIQKLFSSNGKTKYQVSNLTDFTFRFKGLSKEWAKQLEILPRSAVTLTVPDQLTSIETEITNWHIGLKENLVRELNLNP
jgi:predicted metal-dependent phosphoesterase TrpH